MQVALHTRFAGTMLLRDHVDRDCEFIALLNAYRASGGLYRADEIADLLRRHGMENYMRLARRLAGREILSFRWNEVIWVPAFQLRGPELEVREEVCEVLDELAPVMEGFEIAQWFVAPNLWLGGAAPLRLIHSCGLAVKDAARADRFIIKG